MKNSNLFETAERHFGAGDFLLAISTYKACIKANIKKGESCTRLASIMLRQGSFFKAKKLNEQALKGSSYRIEALYNQAYIDTKEGSFQSATNYIQKALILAPKSVDLLLLDADIKKKMGNYNAAENIYSYILSEIDPAVIKAYLDGAELYQEQGKYEKALALLERGQKFDPHNLKVNNLVLSIKALLDAQGDLKEIASELMSDNDSPELMKRWQSMYHKSIHSRPNGGFHISMLNDMKRNEAFHLAIKNKVNADKSVLDIGAGTGLLSLMARNAGARAIAACEFSPHMYFLMEKTLQDNNALPDVNLIFGNAFALNKEKVGFKPDVILMELIGDAVVGENMLPILNTLRYTGLLDDTEIIPYKAVLKVAPITSASLEIDAHLKFAEICGINLSFYQQTSFLENELLFTRKPRKYLPPFSIVDDAVTLFEFDFRKTNLLAAKKNVKINISKKSEILGVVVYFDLHLDEKTIYTTNDADSCWTNDIWFFKQPISLLAGSALKITAEYNHDKFKVTRIRPE